MNHILVNTSCNKNDFVVEFEVIQPGSDFHDYNSTHNWIMSQIDNINNDISDIENSIYNLDKKIDKYTNKADRLDYTIAVASGLLCGVIDSIFVGSFSFDEGLQISKEKMEEKIINLAKEKGWKGVTRGERKGQFPLDKAIEFLEDKFKMPSDPLKDIFGGSKQHHLRDFSHHRSPIGLFFSILTQFTKNAYGTDTYGNFIKVPVPEEMIGKDYKRKFAIAVTDWALHLASDMHGSNATAGAGCGIPGPFLSLIKAFSALPIFKSDKVGDNKISLFVSKLYNGTLLADRDENGRLVPVKIDLRGEMAIKYELGKQMLPIIINDVIVRSFYLLRRLYLQLKEKNISSWSDVSKIDWKKVIPLNNRTINNMMIVASGTFMAVDFADASLRAALLSGGNWAMFGKELLLRVNFVGIGRFCIALGVDFHMAQKKNKLRTERIWLTNQMLLASNAKLFYKQADIWIAARNAEQAIHDLYVYIENIKPFITDSFISIRDDLEDIPSLIPSIQEKKPNLIPTLLKILND